MKICNWNIWMCMTTVVSVRAVAAHLGNFTAAQPMTPVANGPYSHLMTDILAWKNGFGVITNTIEYHYFRKCLGTGYSKRSRWCGTPRWYFTSPAAVQSPNSWSSRIFAASYLQSCFRNGGRYSGLNGEKEKILSEDKRTNFNNKKNSRTVFLTVERRFEPAIAAVRPNSCTVLFEYTQVAR